MFSLVQVLLVALLGVIGNIFYFEYQSRKKSSKEILKERLINLLLPLYLTLQDNEMNTTWVMRNDDFALYEAEKPIRLFKELQDIIYKNLYLADDELHKACLNFLNWAINADEDERFQKIYSSSLGLQKVDVV